MQKAKLLSMCSLYNRIYMLRFNVHERRIFSSLAANLSQLVKHITKVSVLHVWYHICKFRVTSIHTSLDFNGCHTEKSSPNRGNLILTHIMQKSIDHSIYGRSLSTTAYLAEICRTAVFIVISSVGMLNQV